MYSSEDLERFYFLYKTEALSSEDMSESQKDHYIDYWADRVTNLDLDKCAMELVIEDFLKIQQEMRESRLLRLIVSSVW